MSLVNTGHQQMRHPEWVQTLWDSFYLSLGSSLMKNMDSDGTTVCWASYGLYQAVLSVLYCSIGVKEYVKLVKRLMMEVLKVFDSTSILSIRE